MLKSLKIWFFALLLPLAVTISAQGQTGPFNPKIELQLLGSRGRVSVSFQFAVAYPVDDVAAFITSPIAHVNEKPPAFNSDKLVTLWRGDMAIGDTIVKQISFPSSPGLIHRVYFELKGRLPGSNRSIMYRGDVDFVNIENVVVVAGHHSTLEGKMLAYELKKRGLFGKDFEYIRQVDPLLAVRLKHPTWKVRMDSVRAPDGAWLPVPVGPEALRAVLPDSLQKFYNDPELVTQEYIKIKLDKNKFPQIPPPGYQWPDSLASPLPIEGLSTQERERLYMQRIRSAQKWLAHVWKEYWSSERN